MSRVVCFSLPSQQVERLDHLAQQLGRTASETGALLIEEALRQMDFPQIEFRNSPAGQQAFVKGSTLAVWEVIFVAENYSRNAERTAQHLDWPTDRVQAAFNYAEAFPLDMGEAIREIHETDFERLKGLLPNAELVRV